MAAAAAAYNGSDGGMAMAAAAATASLRHLWRQMAAPTVWRKAENVKQRHITATYKTNNVAAGSGWRAVALERLMAATAACAYRQPSNGSRRQRHRSWQQRKSAMAL